MSAPKLKTATADGVFTITLDDPPANTYSYEMMRELEDAVLQARKDADPTFKYYFCLHANETLNRLEQTPKLGMPEVALGVLPVTGSESDDAKEGLLANLEKRTPDFSGR